MGSLGLVPHGESAHHSRLLVDAKHLADLGRAVAEDADEPPHILPQQAEHDGLGKGDVGVPGQPARGQGLLDAAGGGDGLGTGRATLDPTPIDSLFHGRLAP